MERFLHLEKVRSEVNGRKSLFQMVYNLGLPSCKSVIQIYITCTAWEPPWASHSFFLFFNGCTCSMWKFPGWGSNLYLCSNLSHCSPILNLLWHSVDSETLILEWLYISWMNVCNQITYLPECKDDLALENLSIMQCVALAGEREKIWPPHERDASKAFARIQQPLFKK